MLHFALLFSAVLLAVNAQEEVAKTPLQAVAESNDEFTMTLHQQFSENLSENVITSPLSLEVVLGMTLQGAKGTTRQQIIKTLSLPEDDTVVRTGFQQLLKPLRSNENMTLHVADAIFVQKDFPLNSEFVSVARSSFAAEGRSEDFVKDLSNSIDDINAWVEKETNSKIKDLVSRDNVDESTRLVLVNALYFKGLWTRSFNASLTKKLPFHVTKSKTVDTDMMTTMDKFGYTESQKLNAQILEMKYRGDEVRLVLVLPQEVDGLAELSKKLKSLDDIPMELPKRDVIVTIPKFKLEQTIKYTDVLQKLGMTALFSPEANLSGITTAESLYVSDVVQKSYIEVNEEGSEAASATDIGFETTAVVDPVDKTTFKADHGYMYLIQHIPTKSVLFYGHYVKPEVK